MALHIPATLARYEHDFKLEKKTILQYLWKTEKIITTGVCLVTPTFKGWFKWLWLMVLTHWGRVTHICISNLTIIGSDNSLLPGRCQAIIWTNAGILLIGNKLQWNLNWNSSILIQENAFESVIWKMAAILSRPQCVKLYHMTSVWNVVFIDSRIKFQVLVSNSADAKYTESFVHFGSSSFVTVMWKKADYLLGTYGQLGLFGYYNHWQLTVVMMPNLLWMVALEAVIMKILDYQLLPSCCNTRFGLSFVNVHYGSGSAWAIATHYLILPDSWLCHNET